jgi:hypothetical protein
VNYTSGTSGSFSFSGSFSQGDGGLSFWLEPSDGVGDESVGIFEYSITGTSAGTTTINSVSDNVEGGVVGVVSSSGLSNDRTLTLAGNAAAGSTVSVKSVDTNNIETKIGTVKADLNGAWTLTTTELVDGEYSFVAIATDLSGNSSSSDPYSVTVDATAPATPSGLTLRSGIDPSSAAITGAVTSQSGFFLHGTADAGSSVTVFNGGTELTTELTTVTADSNGKWVFELKDLENGNAYNFRASSSDLAGNSSAISGAIAISVITSPSDAPQIINVSDDVTDGVYADKGSVANGDVSNDQTLDLTGVAAAGIQVNIYDGDKKIGETFSDDSTGAWLWTTDELGEGIHSFSVTTTTASGVESAASDPWDVSIDVTAPDKPGTITVSDDVGLRTGSLAVIGNVTEDNSLTLSGTVEAGAKVYIYDSTTEIGVVEADEATGDWVFQTGVLADGKHSFTVMASDKAGNESKLSDAFNLTVDTTTPAPPTISNVKNGPTDLTTGTFNQASSVELSGTATAGMTVVIYNGAQQLAKVTAEPDGKWSYQATGLADGSTYVWTAKAENSAGTLSAPSANPFTLTIDRTAPILSTTTELLSNANGPLLKENSGTDQVIYTATAADIDGNGVKWSLTGTDAASFAVSQEGVITLKDNPNYDEFNADGTSGATAKPNYNFTLVGTDSAGNFTTKNLTLGIQNVDEVAPTFGDATVSVAEIKAGSGANQLVYDANATDLDGSGVLTYTLGGANADRFSIEANTGKVYLIENPTPSVDEVLKYTVTATDPTGNKTTTSELSLAIKYVDITAPDAPEISGVFNAAGTTNLGVVLNGTESNGSVVVKGLAEAGSTVTVNWGNNQTKTTVATGGAWEVTFLSTEIPADAASAPITATATDKAGNKSGITTFDVAIDRVIAQPSLSPVSPDGIINAAEALNLVLSGTSEVGSSITLKWNGFTYTNGNGANDIQLDADGVWTLAVPVANVPTGTGTSDLTLSAVDAAGNVSTALIQAIAYDRGAPTVTVTDNVAGTANLSTAETGFAYTYTFSEAVTDLKADDFEVVNGSVSGVSGSGSTYTVTVAPDMDVTSGVISMTLKADAVLDAAGNGNGENVNALQAIDTLAPQGLTLNPIATDNVVNAAEKTAGFTIGGDVEAGTTVSVLWGNQTRAATVTGSTWSLAYTNNQIPADGNQTITVTATDPAGNTSVVSRAIRVDTVAPTATVNSLSFSADSGTSSTDFITNIAGQTISGQLSGNTATGDVVEVSLNNGSSWATADNTIGSRAFSLAGVTLTSSNTLQVRVKDSAGNTGAVRSQAYVLDTAASNRTVTGDITLSADSGFSTTDRLTNVASQTFSGTLNGNVLAGERVQFSLNNGATWGTATTTTNRASFTFTGALAQGANAVKVRHLDVAGNASAEYSTTVTLDNTVATVRGVTIPSATSGSTYKVGDVVDVTVQFSEAVRVTGTPRLGLLVGTNTRQAAYLSGTNSNTLTFRYTIAAGDSDLDGISINAGSLNLNAGTIADAAGNNANIANPAVAANANSKVDGSLPTLLSTEVVNGNVVMTFSEALASTSLTPSFFTLSAGGPATGASVSGNQVTLTPTTAITATAAAGLSVSYNDGSTTDLSTGSIQDQAGNDAATFSNAAATKITATGPISLAATTTFTTAQLGGTAGDAITGNASANTLIGNSGNNRITGGGGADTLTGGLGADTFAYGTNSDSLRASFDKITDFVIGTDSIDAARTSGALGASKGTVRALTAAGISAVLTNTTFSAATNAAWFTFGSGATQRTFLALNDGTRGFSGSTDAIIEMTGVTGNMANLTVI